MSIQRIDQHLGGIEQDELQVPLAGIYSGGDYAMGSAVVEIALKNMGLPTRNFLLHNNNGYYRMVWWQLEYNGWEYPEPREIGISEDELVVFGVVRSSHQAFNEGQIRAARSNDGWSPFEAPDALFGVTITQANALHLIAINDVDATVTYYAESDRHLEHNVRSHKVGNALGINEGFLAGLTPEQATQYIKTVYRKLSTMFHPDIGENDRSVMQRINSDNARLLQEYGVTSGSS